MAHTVPRKPLLETFSETDELAVPPEEAIYNREIEVFERTEGLIHPVGVDVLVNGLVGPGRRSGDGSRDRPREVESHLHPGDQELLLLQLREAEEFIEEGGLDHQFKSLFGKTAASSEDIDALVSFLERQLG